MTYTAEWYEGRIAELMEERDALKAENTRLNYELAVADYPLSSRDDLRKAREEINTIINTMLYE